MQVVGAATRLRRRLPVPAVVRPRRLRSRFDGAAAARDVLGFQIGDGTAQIMKTIIARTRAGRVAVPA